MNRRQVLHALAGAIALTSGCLSDAESPVEPTSTATPTTTQDTTTAPTETTTRIVDARETIEVLPQKPPEGDVDCGDESLTDVKLGGDSSHPQRTAGFELEASTDTVTVGDDITFELTYTGSEVRTIGEIYKYNIQYRNGDEWKRVYATPDPLWTDLGILVEAGAGYRWPFTFDREGLARRNGHGNPSYHVCPFPGSGTYRFVFDGLPDDATVSVQFTVERA